MTLAERVERVLQSAAPSLGGVRDLEVEDAICDELGVDPGKFLRFGNACGCRRSRARRFEGRLLCQVYDIPEVRIPQDWNGGFQRPGPQAQERWRRRLNLPD